MKRHTVKILITINVLILVFFLVCDMAGLKIVDSALKAFGLDKAVAWGVQFWIVCSTLVATAVFLWELVKNSDAEGRVHRTRGAVTLDGVMLLVWWIMLVALCVYAFALGMAA